MKFGKGSRQSTNFEDQRGVPTARLRTMMDWVMEHEPNDPSLTEEKTDEQKAEERELDYANEKRLQSTEGGRLHRGNIKGRRRIRLEDRPLTKFQQRIAKSSGALGNLSRGGERTLRNVERGDIVADDRERTRNEEYRRKGDKRYKPYGPGGEYEGM